MTPPLAQPLPPLDDVACGVDAPADLDLHRWRRLDWSLLLPGLGVGRIACAGRVDEQLRAALPLLGQDVREPRGTADWAALSGSCDAVVLVHPTRADLRPAVDALRPGGWLYAEVRRGRLAVGPRTVGGWRAAFLRAGLGDVTAYWHLPGPNGPSALVPLDAGTALRHVIGRREAGRLRAVRPGLEGLLLTTRLLPRAIGEGSVAGRRPLAGS